MVSTDAILFYVISLLNSGDSSLRFGMTIYYFVWEGGKKWRFAEIYRRGPKQSFRIATSFPPSTTVSPCHSERQRGISGTFDHLSSVIKAENHGSAEK